MGLKESEVLRAIRQIERMVLDGWSVQYARKVCCKSNTSLLGRAVIRHPEYLNILNYYMSTQSNPHFYTRDERGLLRPMRKTGNGK